MTADFPETIEPLGVVRANSTPLLLVTGMTSLSGLTAICALTLGLKDPISRRSSGHAEPRAARAVESVATNQAEAVEPVVRDMDTLDIPAFLRRQVN